MAYNFETLWLHHGRRQCGTGRVITALPLRYPSLKTHARFTSPDFSTLNFKMRGNPSENSSRRFYVSREYLSKILSCIYAVFIVTLGLIIYISDVIADKTFRPVVRSLFSPFELWKKWILQFFIKNIPHLRILFIWKHFPFWKYSSFENIFHLKKISIREYFSFENIFHLKIFFY